ncbi:NAD(P)-binding protein [candidate division GN15 bacterium]|nr:NAD(P)-binding protein [candidate division GN15 bacterium]
MVEPKGSKHRTVIIGGGFGGLYAAIKLRKVDTEVVLIDRRNFHLFQPLLYQVATGGLSPGDIASPLRTVLKKNKNTRVVMSRATDIDPRRQVVHTDDGEVEFDSLVVATGMDNFYFGNDEWQSYAPGLKTVEDAREMRRRILLAFETAEKETDPERRKKWLTFVVVGGGPTGVELAGALSEIARHTFRQEFRRIDPDETRVILLEGADKVLPAMPGSLPDKARKSLEKINVDVRTGYLVSGLEDGKVTYKDKDDNEYHIEAQTVLWGAGVRATGLGEKLAARDERIQTDKQGRVKVNADMSVPGHPNIYVIGDLAHFARPGDEPLPGLAAVAMQQGKYVADHIKCQLSGGNCKPFKYFDKGNLATIGRHLAVGRIWNVKVSGTFAWLAWLFVHLMYIVEYGNRLLIFVQWAWNYFTWARGARLITHEAVRTDSTSQQAMTPLLHGETKHQHEHHS